MKRLILLLFLMILVLTACGNTSTSGSTRLVAPAPKTIQTPTPQAASQTGSSEPLPSATSVQSDAVVTNEEATNSLGPTAANCEGKRQEGTVKWFADDKGYGFITSDEGNDVFVHYSGILGEGYRTLQEGQRVEYCVEDGPKGPQAVNVQVIEP